MLKNQGANNESAVMQVLLVYLYCLNTFKTYFFKPYTYLYRLYLSCLFLNKNINDISIYISIVMMCYNIIIVFKERCFSVMIEQHALRNNRILIVYRVYRQAAPTNLNKLYTTIYVQCELLNNKSCVYGVLNWPHECS